MKGGGIHPRSGKPSLPSWRIELRTVDEPFAQAFAIALGRSVKRPENRRVKVLPPQAPGGIGNRPQYRVCVASRGFGDWWQEVGGRRNLLWPHVKDQPAAFLRGLYDSEGNLGYTAKGTPVCRIFNTDQEILALAQDCLGELDMHAEQRLFRAARQVMVMGRTVNARPLYYLAPLPARTFLRIVGSNIPAKATPIHI
jgi:hypothetical protein